jgi:hypothetical protein
MMIVMAPPRYARLEEKLRRTRRERRGRKKRSATKSMVHDVMLHYAWVAGIWCRRQSAVAQGARPVVDVRVLRQKGRHVMGNRLRWGGEERAEVMRSRMVEAAEFAGDEQVEIGQAFQGASR